MNKIDTTLFNCLINRYPCLHENKKNLNTNKIPNKTLFEHFVTTYPEWQKNLKLESLFFWYKKISYNVKGETCHAIINVNSGDVYTVQDGKITIIFKYVGGIVSRVLLVAEQMYNHGIIVLINLVKIFI